MVFCVFQYHLTSEAEPITNNKQVHKETVLLVWLEARFIGMALWQMEFVTH
jgi:hypothetical protein